MIGPNTFAAALAIVLSFDFLPTHKRRVDSRKVPRRLVLLHKLCSTISAASLPSSAIQDSLHAARSANVWKPISSSIHLRPEVDIPY